MRTSPSLNASLKAAIGGALFLAVAVLNPTGAVADQWFSQAIPLLHIPLGNGLVFTSNYAFAATGSGAVTVNVKCFNDASQRIGPAPGVNVPLPAAGAVALHTPPTLAVTTDPLFLGSGWCWAQALTAETFSSQITVGATTNLGPGAIQNDPNALFVGNSTGLAVTSRKLGIPYVTIGPGIQDFAMIVNPNPSVVSAAIGLWNASGVLQSPGFLIRNFPGRSLQVLSIPSDLGVVTPPPSGSVAVGTAEAIGLLGWFFSVRASTNRATFLPAAADFSLAGAFLDPAAAP